MILLILLTVGSWRAYPQYNFPETLTKAELFWSQVYALPSSAESNKIIDIWKDNTGTSLTMEHAHALGKLLAVWNHEIQTLPKSDQLFAVKHGHLSFYLSAINLLHTSSFDRSGPWMLTYPDASRYGLVVNDLVDERRDFVKSTQAARLLFDDLKAIHGANAEVAFVMGAAGWKRADQATITQTELQLTALRILVKNVKNDNLTRHLSNGIKQSFQEEIDVNLLLAELSIDDAQFRVWNPAIIGAKIPPHRIVLLPAVIDGHDLANASRELAITNKRLQDSLMLKVRNNIPSATTHQATTYRVRSGDVLGKIAERYGVSVANIKKWNNLRSDRININQKLTIYLSKGKSSQAAVEEIPLNVEVSTTPKPNTEEKGTFTIYEVQPGDTLWAISRRFEGVNPEQIMAWNGIGEALSIGQKLKIKVLK